ncbi:MAG TPA: ectonucleotide pyrophosphatase/phosphodiesterase [Thermoguttaceae bacterium]|nr:ectonucleotide pyrophosphatase/phosphodiesterase [Thermoguttaceae bacterium]
MLCRQAASSPIQQEKREPSRAVSLILTCLVLTIVFLLLLTGHVQAEPRKDHCVILVSIDGLAGFYLDDPKAQMPTIRRLAKEGARASGMVTCFPSVTWPAHATLSTGVSPARHGMIGNSYLDRKTGQVVGLLCDPVYEKDQVLKVPTIYDVAYKAGLKTAGVLWPITRGATTLNWFVPDMSGDDTWEKLGTRSWLEELRAEGIPVDRHGQWCREPAGGVQRDWLYSRMAAQLIRRHQPNLILIHLVEPDHVQHRTGPRSPEAYWCASYSDDRIRDLVEAVADSPLAGKTTFVICSDHGFFPITKDIRPNVLLRQKGLIQVKDGKTVSRSAYCVSQGGGMMVYILDDARRDALRTQLRKELAQIEGVQAVFGPEEFGKIGQPTPEQNPWGADLWLAAESGYSFSDGFAGEEVVVARQTVGGTHGYFPDQPDMHAMCILWGPDVRPGTQLGKVESRDIAPTIARLLGLEMPTAEGRALVEPSAASAGKQ